jgi:maltose/moltooligosaccharide transporter
MRHMTTKPELSHHQIWNMSVGFLGIQAGFALQNSNASGILQRLGAHVEQLPSFWLVAPVIGMLVQPIVGHFSDRTWTRLGRRKPYFLAGAIAAAIGMILMPNAGLLALLLTPVLMGAVMLILMDASFNVAMEPFRALVADKLPSEQRTYGFAAQTALIGLGALVGSWLPYFLHHVLGINDVAAEGLIPDHIRYSFYIGAGVFMAAILWTLVTTKEYSPEEVGAFSGPSHDHPKAGNFFRDLGEDFVAMPVVMRQLGAVQFFSWFALFSMWVFTTPAIANHIYGCAIDDTKSEMFSEAGTFTGVIFGIYNIVSAVYAICIPAIARQLGRRNTHALSLLCGGVGLLSIYVAPSPNYLILSMIGVGIAWGSILSMPYAMLAGSIPAHKMGIYMGIFNFFITIPQIVSGVVNRPIVSMLFGNRAIYAIMMGGVFFLLAAASCYLIDKQADGLKDVPEA